VDHEGYNVAQWLNERGVAAFVLKNRLAKETNSTYKIDVEALADTQRAVRLVRSRAKEWGINPQSVGVMGFSAGGELAALVSVRFDGGKEGASDLIERQSCKPDFQALIYPGRSRDIQPMKERLQRPAGHRRRSGGSLPTVQENRRAGRTAHLFRGRARLWHARWHQGRGRRLARALRGMAWRPGLSQAAVNERTES
jgi:acetyl esterase/lipase